MKILCSVTIKFYLPPYLILAKTFSLASGAMFCVPGNVPFFNIVMAFFLAISNKRFLSMRFSEFSRLDLELDLDLLQGDMYINMNF